jgi:hypothetical protein
MNFSQQTKKQFIAMLIKSLIIGKNHNSKVIWPRLKLLTKTKQGQLNMQKGFESFPNDLCLGLGVSFGFVSGLGLDLVFGHGLGLDIGLGLGLVSVFGLESY